MTNATSVGWWHVVVRDRDTGAELARYTYPTRAQASEAARSVREVRRQNHERVNINVVKG